MGPSEMEQANFCAWLCTQEHTVFPAPASIYGSPLACWLTAVTGQLYGVDGEVYGLALCEEMYWKPLPCWAKLLVARLDACLVQPLSGWEVFVLLAGVEVALMHLRTRRQRVSVEAGLCLCVS